MKRLTVNSYSLLFKSLFVAALFLPAALHVSFIKASAENIQARAAVVMEAATGRVLYAKNPELRLMPASTTKLMTALLTVEKANLKDIVTVSRNAANVAPTRSGFREGDKVTIETLLYAALIKSANDAAVALAEAVGGTEEKFVAMMNRRAIALGANETKFINPNGLPGPGQHTTAYDLAKIMRQALRHPVLKEIIGTRVTELSSENGRTVTVRNTNKLLWTDDDLVGGKTGFTYAAGHCFVCAGERDKYTLIVSLLGAPSRGDLWKETEELMAFGSKVLQNQEEPVVYLTRSDYDSASVSKASYAKKAKPKIRPGMKNVKMSAKLKKIADEKALASNASAKVKAKTAKSSQAIKVKGGAKAKKNEKIMVKAKKNKKTNMAGRRHNVANG